MDKVIIPSVELKDFQHSRESKKSITFIVTEDCNFRCKYCYMSDKNKKNKMSFETAKDSIDYLLNNKELFSNKEVLWDFIGGEPLLEIDLIDKIVDYIILKSYELNHPWFEHSWFSISTNGSLYNTKEVQNFITKRKSRVEVGFTIDGPDYVHDSERIFPDGRGTHKSIIKNISTWLQDFPKGSTKVTIARNGLPFIAESVLYLFSIGIKTVNINVVFEDVWQPGDDEIFEKQLDILGDAIIEQNLWGSYTCSFFSSGIGKPLLESGIDDNSWCGSGRHMLAIDSRGNFYPCVRFSQFCLTEKPSIIIGDIKNGINIEKLIPFYNLTRKNVSPQMCMDCDVASGCAWCPGFNYDDSKDSSIFNRATYICLMHKARVRSNNRFWEKLNNYSNFKEQRMENCQNENCQVGLKCGMVEKEECEEIKELYLRKSALIELFVSLAKLDDIQMNKLYEKLLKDISRTNFTFQNWWDRKSKKYDWPINVNGQWKIDFETCEIFLVEA